jgi:hypothetical protein
VEINDDDELSCNDTNTEYEKGDAILCNRSHAVAGIHIGNAAIHEYALLYTFTKY